ncbi:MAG: hypothetical protein ACLFUS_13970, partial [Candidatus Sumerlaeia bacterium]
YIFFESAKRLTYRRHLAGKMASDQITNPDVLFFHPPSILHCHQDGGDTYRRHPAGTMASDQITNTDVLSFFRPVVDQALLSRTFSPLLLILPETRAMP